MSSSNNEGNKKSTLTDKEEKILFKQIKEGRDAARLLNKKNISDSEKRRLLKTVEIANDAKKSIFDTYLYLIDEVKYNYCYNPMYWLEDVEQDAAIKLLECIDKYDMNNPASFSTYARKCITGSVIDSLAENTSLLRKTKVLSREYGS